MSQFTDKDRTTLIECRTILERMAVDVGGHEERIRKVETRQVWIMGAGGGIGFCLASLYQYLKLK